MIYTAWASDGKTIVELDAVHPAMLVDDDDDADEFSPNLAPASDKAGASFLRAAGRYSGAVGTGKIDA